MRSNFRVQKFTDVENGLDLASSHRGMLVSVSLAYDDYATLAASCGRAGICPHWSITDHLNSVLGPACGASRS